MGTGSVRAALQRRRGPGTRGASVVLLAPLALGACTLPPPNLIARVQVFHRLAPGERGSIAVKAMEDRKADSLEFARCAQQVERYLAANGFILAGPGVSPDFEARLDYGIDEGKATVHHEQVPIRGVVGYNHMASSPPTPVYGTTGYQTIARDEIVFTRTLALDILRSVRRGEYLKVYEAKVLSRGGSGQFLLVAEPMLRALCSDFPGPASGTRRVSISYTGC
ncbi:MAG: hypothetical protein EXQ85_06165 [Alphaproteobacteria bacterium]|nr:hypothetical protein [Alphaproteobacteria bacterium]